MTPAQDIDGIVVGSGLARRRFFDTLAGASSRKRAAVRLDDEAGQALALVEFASAPDDVVVALDDLVEKLGAANAAFRSELCEREGLIGEARVWAAELVAENALDQAAKGRP
jgi:hypothetical protein